MVRTSTESPWPTSITSISACPGCGRWRSGRSNGRNRSKASGFPGVARGSNSHRAPTQARPTASSPGSGSQTIAAGQFATRCRSDQSPSIRAAESCQQNPAAAGDAGNSTRPASASGTTPKLITGIPIRLARGPGSDAWPKNHTVSGNNPRTATPCASRNGLIQPLPCCRGKHQSSQPTPAKLSQKPGASTDSGSNSNTARRASAKDSLPDCARRSSFASNTTAIISSVRTVGNAKPASAV